MKVRQQVWENNETNYCVGHDAARVDLAHNCQFLVKVATD